MKILVVSVMALHIVFDGIGYIESLPKTRFVGYNQNSVPQSGDSQSSDNAVILITKQNVNKHLLHAVLNGVLNKMLRRHSHSSHSRNHNILRMPFSMYNPEAEKHKKCNKQKEFCIKYFCADGDHECIRKCGFKYASCVTGGLIDKNTGLPTTERDALTATFIIPTRSTTESSNRSTTESINRPATISTTRIATRRTTRTTTRRTTMFVDLTRGLLSRG